MLSNKTINEMMKNPELAKEVKENLGKFLREVNKDFNTNLLYSMYLNFDDLIYLYENNKEDLKDRNNMLDNFLKSQFVSNDEKDLLLNKLRDYEIDKETFKKFFENEFSIHLKRKYFKDYFDEEDNFYKYAWGEDIPIEWINNDLKDLNHKEKFYYLFGNRDIPSECIKLEYLLEIYDLKHKFSLDDNEFNEQELKIRKEYYALEYIRKYINKMPLEEKFKFLNLDLEEQAKFFENDTKKLIFYKHFLKYDSIRINEKREEIFNGKDNISYKEFPLEIKLCLLNYSKKDLDSIVKKEIKDYFKKFPKDKMIHFKQSNILFAISLAQDFDDELFFNYGTVMDASTMIYNKQKKDIPLETLKNIILHYPKEREIFSSVLWHKNFENISKEDEDFYFKNGYLNKGNIFSYLSNVKIKNEDILESLVDKENSFNKNIFEIQVLSKDYMEKNREFYRYDHNNIKNYYYAQTHQENLPDSFIKEFKDKGHELYLLTNFNYMYNKNVDKYKEKISEMLPIKSKLHSGGDKFDFIMGFVMNKVLQKNKLKVEYNNNSIKFLKEKEYYKKYKTAFNNQSKNDDSLGM